MFAGGLKSEFSPHIRAIVQELYQPSNGAQRLKKVAGGAKKDSPDLARIAWRLRNEILQTPSAIVGAERFGATAPRKPSRADQVARAILVLQKTNPGIAGEIFAGLVKKFIDQGVLKIEGLYVNKKA